MALTILKEDEHCHICGKSTDRRLDKNGKVYYACGHCQTRVFYGVAPSEAYKESVRGDKENGKVQSIREEQQREQSGTTEREARGESITGNGTTGTTSERAREPDSDDDGFSIFG